ncbi:MAG TPA: glycoside hydrolase family 43 protein [Polyangiaceae bacterium]|nr:glycoside hydrolase family 43 protein [Polyangiaceae bacterium]
MAYRQIASVFTVCLSARRAAAGIFAATTVYSAAALADNPIVQTNYTADPAPMVYEGRLYLYTSHDEDVTVNNFFTMNDWRLYSTIDMVNWTDHGSPAGYKSFSWGKDSAWAIQVVPRNGKFYLYAPLNNNSGSKIGVAVGQNPAGPFTDPLGKGLIESGSGNIDPTVFIDDDGQAYLYWGNPDLRYVKLNSDMISFAGSPTKVALTTGGFGVRSNTDRATAYEEGPWFYKRNALYYIVYPADGTPEKISYTTSSGPLGDWMYRGDIMAKETGSGGSFTNHPGVVDYKGHSYFFYHNAALPGGGGYKRSVCVEEFTYGADGTIPAIKMSTGGPKAVENLNPFQRVEAETIAFSSGLKTETCSEGGIDVTSISNGDYIKVKNVDFGSGATSFDARVASANSGASIELHLDSQTGTSLGTCAVPATGGAKTWMTKTCPVTGATGVHDLFLKFTGGSGDLFNFNWWQFSGPGGMDMGSGGTGSGGASSGGAGTLGGSGGQSGKPDGGAIGLGGGVASAGTGGITVGGAGMSPSTGGGGSSSTSSGGRTSSAGSTSANGGSTPGATPPVADASGCSCRSSAARGGSPAALAMLALSAVILHRRRKSRAES